MSARVEFRLSMPNRASWDGGWSGESKNFVIYRTLNAVEFARVFGGEATATFFHHWSDGWTAAVAVRRLAPGEKHKRSDGFSGYDWMVSNIIKHGSTKDLTVSAPMDAVDA